ncbi:MAG TPA: hypothetical protein PLK89_05965 [Acidobacteriota bacterium]|jgi:hypothetical protein|nr:hypothetical protein [Acidobacteriota bacterium]
MIFIVLFLLAGIVGFISLYIEINDCEEKIKFLEDYRNKFRRYCWEKLSADSRDTLHDWLIKNQTRAHSELGPYGALAYYKPPYHNPIPNFQLLPNIIPRFTEFGVDDVLFHRADEALLLVGGELSHQSQLLRKTLTRPWLWFGRGAKKLITSPISIVQKMNLISDKQFSSLENSLLVNIIGSLFNVVNLVGSTFSIISGWEKVLH